MRPLHKICCRGAEAAAALGRGEADIRSVLQLIARQRIAARSVSDETCVVTRSRARKTQGPQHCVTQVGAVWLTRHVLYRHGE
jgi:hypothetical protein